ncbi:MULTISPECIES: ABC transporter substrate-binding protein [unclassified Bradyrhizobium]|uniref:ABC transporter substrate-binding protein n=1 Tax=unclassified Bradyrhizobium TaxID=2631580 RepID=UPI001FF52EB5|nr:MULTISPECIES: ABC transporter substrate-binding protein [unclassified Bradyrhizobium]MCJ9699879.1 ABC transporter substrate-binding protein [Bradyrhizobium sp. SHOUNA76]MCJ9728886.1 ABC transporter substrate-binding protein [Bradyrhizobium sp. PRIMUS42]
MFKLFRPFIALMLMSFGSAAYAADAPGVTPSEIKIGGVFPFSGPASPYGVIGQAILAYAQSVNDRGGINGRKINYIMYDDAYSPPKAVEQVRKLVEGDEVAFIYGQLGTPGNTAVAKYLIAKRVPSIGIITGSNKFTNVSDYPLTTTSIVSYDTEGKIYAKFLTKTMPNAKYGILYQNDDLGKDYVNAFKAILKGAFEAKVVAVSYEVSDPTVDSQILNLKSSGADALLVAGTPKFAAQAIRRAAEIGWKPTIVLNYPSGSVSATLKPAGLERAVGVIVGQNLMDPVDTQWANDAGMKGYRTFIEKYMPGADFADTNIQYGYAQAALLEHLIKQCGSDLSRENIIKQAKSLKNVMLPTLLPGISVSTSDKINMNYTQMKLQRWSGTAWELFGEVLDASSE